MCGICVIATCLHTPSLPEWGQRGVINDCDEYFPTRGQLESVLHRRGPDLHGVEHVAVGDATLELIGASLCLRGRPTRQPFRTQDSKNWLLFNGEIFAGDVNVGNDENDVEALSSALDASEDDGIMGLMDSIKGPWSMIYWRESQQRLYFGRDVVGRRSLLIKNIPGKGFVVTSASAVSLRESSGFCELPPTGLFYANYANASSVSFGVVERTRQILVRPVGRIGSVACDCSASLSDAAMRFILVFREALTRRLACNEKPSSTSRFAVLFSGGIDSLFIARMLDATLPSSEPFELVNIAFGKDRNACSACPDRQNALTGYAELLESSQTERRVDLVLVDVEPEQADLIAHKHVKHLISPRNEPMDRSIGTALWSASRGIGHLHPGCEEGDASWRVSSKILFNGLGVDEMMGGYKGRHRTKYRIGGQALLASELNDDVGSLWWRNLGRDDRLVSDHGREVRHPFLDEDLISYVMSLPLETVCNLELPDGVGDKALLRTAARLVGLSENACRRSKRAIQFGSRSKQVLERKRSLKVNEVRHYYQESSVIPLNHVRSDDDRRGGCT